MGIINHIFGGSIAPSIPPLDNITDENTELILLEDKIEKMKRHLNYRDSPYTGDQIIKDFRKAHGIENGAQIPTRKLHALKTALSNEMRECGCGSCFNEFLYR